MCIGSKSEGAHIVARSADQSWHAVPSLALARARSDSIQVRRLHFPSLLLDVTFLAVRGQQTPP